MPEEDGYSFMKRWRAYEVGTPAANDSLSRTRQHLRARMSVKRFSLQGFKRHLTALLDESALVSSFGWFIGKPNLLFLYQFHLNNSLVLLSIVCAAKATHCFRQYYITVSILRLD